MDSELFNTTFQHPFSMVVADPLNSNKTFFVKTMTENAVRQKVRKAQEKIDNVVYIF